MSATNLAKFSGTSHRGNLSEAFNLAIAKAKHDLGSDLVSYALNEIRGINGGVVMQNDITVTLTAEKGPNPPAPASTALELRLMFALSNHKLLTQEVGQGYVAQRCLTQSELNWIVICNLAEDNPINQAYNEVHFDNCYFEGGIEQIETKWSGIYRHPHRRSLHALGLFGNLLHTVQDFYAHSDWVEYHIMQPTILLWDFNMAHLPGSIISGTWPLGKGSCRPGTPSHGDLNKDSNTSKKGSTEVPTGPHARKSYFDVAFEVAKRATREQFKEYFGFYAAVDVPRVESDEVNKLEREMKDRAKSYSDYHTNPAFGELDIKFAEPACECLKGT